MPDVLDRGWMRRVANSRAVTIMPAGARALAANVDLRLEAAR